MFLGRNGGFHGGTPSSHPFLDGISPYKPSILGYSHLWKPPTASLELCKASSSEKKAPSDVGLRLFKAKPRSDMQKLRLKIGDPTSRAQAAPCCDPSGLSIVGWSQSDFMPIL